MANGRRIVGRPSVGPVGSDSNRAKPICERLTVTDQAIWAYQPRWLDFVHPFATKVQDNFRIFFVQGGHYESLLHERQLPTRANEPRCPATCPLCALADTRANKTYHHIFRAREPPRLCHARSEGIQNLSSKISLQLQISSIIFSTVLFKLSMVKADIVSALATATSTKLRRLIPRHSRTDSRAGTWNQ